MLSKTDKVGKKPRLNRTVISCDRCKARKTKSSDVDGPCDYCRSTEQVCSIDVTKRRQKPFYFVSEEEYRLLRELCARCYPDEDLDVPNLRRLASEAASYMGAESGVSFNSAVRSWMFRISARMMTINEENDKDKIPPPVKMTPPSTRSPLSFSSTPAGQPATLLPPQTVVTSCATRFFEQVHCLYWLFSTEDFYSRLETTYRGGTDKSLQTGSWLCLLQSMVACASCDSGPDDGPRLPESLDKAKALVPKVCDEADLDSIRALILLVGATTPIQSRLWLTLLPQALALQSNGCTNSAYIHIGLAVRIAFSLGLHLDKYSTKDSVVAKAYARRLWWTLFLFDQDLSSQLGRPSMTSSTASGTWQPPLPSEHVVSPGSHTPHGYLEQAIRLAQTTQDIRQRLYSGPVHDNQDLTHHHFTSAIESLSEWSSNMPPHLQLSSSISPLHRRSISLLHLRYWGTLMLVTKPFLLCNLLRGHEIDSTKQSIFAEFSTTCLSAAESSLDIMESMVLHTAVSSLLVMDFYLALQTLQIFLAACGLFQGDVYQNRSRRCLKVLVAIGVSGFPKHLLPETLFQVQQFGIGEDGDDGNQLAISVEGLQNAQNRHQRLNGDGRGLGDNLISNSWLNELNMTDVMINDELWGDIMDLSEIFPMNNLT
ncbi:hypothetical protein CC79DRAFT_1358677 [Sarocladium strictum]